MSPKRAQQAALPLPAAPPVRLVWAGKERVQRQARLASVAGAKSALVPRERWSGEHPERSSRNALILGDNLRALQALRATHTDGVDLIYIDPPFATGGDFEFRAEVGGPGGSYAEAIAASGYSDRWGAGREAWFSMIYERLLLARDLLSERGTLYLHLDWAAGHHVRPLLDEVFGEENSLGEIIWSYGSPSGGRAGSRNKKLVKAHDLIFVFAKKAGSQRFNPVYLPYAERYLRDWFKYKDPDGRQYRKRWRRDKEGESFVEKQYLDESPGVPASTVWSDIQQVYADPRAYRQNMTSEVTGYPTQKPMKLLERILEISSAPGDLVLDFFCGSGTTLLAAEKMGRRWIGCDANPRAVHTVRKRLLELSKRASFEVTSAGRSKDAAAEAARLDLQVSAMKGELALALEGFELKDRKGLPNDVSGLDLVDFWAIDWKGGEVFEADWFAQRTRRDRSLALEAPASAGKGVPASLLVVDVLGRAFRARLTLPEESQAVSVAARAEGPSPG